MRANFYLALGTQTYRLSTRKRIQIPWLLAVRMQARF
jgi:hypothetical protein